MPGLDGVAAVERTAVDTLTRRRAAVAAVVGAGGIVEGNVAGPIPCRRTIVDVEERVVAGRLGAAITRAAGAVAAIIRLEVRAGAPGAAVPLVTGGAEAGLGAGVAGGRREPRPQQQNMYTGAGSQMHGGEYVQLTWLVSG